MDWHTDTKLIHQSSTCRYRSATSPSTSASSLPPPPLKVASGGDLGGSTLRGEPRYPGRRPTAWPMWWVAPQGAGGLSSRSPGGMEVAGVGGCSGIP